MNRVCWRMFWICGILGAVLVPSIIFLWYFVEEDIVLHTIFIVFASLIGFIFFDMAHRMNRLIKNKARISSIDIFTEEL